MTRQIKQLFAKYAGRLDDKLTIKLSEEEIKEQEQEFERIKSLLTNRDISWLPHVLFNQTESNNGTDKARQEAIEKQVRKLPFRIIDEAKEYHELYCRTLYEWLKKMYEKKIETIDAFKELSKKLANHETQTSKKDNGMVQG